MRGIQRAGLISAIGLFAACSSPDADLKRYCEARGQKTLGEECTASAGCCAPYQCEASRCCAPSGEACAGSTCCTGLFCVDSVCGTTPPRDAGPDSGVDAGRDAGP